MDEIEELTKLARPSSLTDLRQARGLLETHLDVVDEQSFDHEFIEVDLARRIAKSLIELIDSADSFDAEQRSMVRAAIDYFILTDDEENDLTSPIGMEDDARVVNAACEFLGRLDLQVEVA